MNRYNTRIMDTRTFMILVFSILIAQNEAAKILAMFPVPSLSHQLVFRILTKELARRGHQVTVITPDPAFKDIPTPANLTEIDVHDLSYNIWGELYPLVSTGKSDVVSQMKVAHTILIDVLEAQFKLDSVQKLFREEKFDLILAEACAKPSMVLSHIFNAPMILVSSFGPFNHNINTMGAAWHPLLYPVIMNARLHNLSNWEKIQELWNLYKFNNILLKLEESENALLKRTFGPDVPIVAELKNKVDMLFMNVHPLWENNRPVPPSVVYMGGIHQNLEKALPSDLQSYLDSSKNGVIYMSLGTNVKTTMLPPDTVRAMVKVLSELPYDVLMKYDGDVLPGQTENIKISKWLPQSDLLRHPNVKLFIMQAGLQSIDEAITAGVPMIGIPFFIDQWYNAEQFVKHHIGIQLDIKTLTEEKFRTAIYQIVGDDSYRKNVLKLRTLMLDQPMKPLERAVWWTEHVLRHGGAAHLRSPAANISWTEYYEIELLSILLVVLLASVFLVMKIARYLVSLFVSNSEKKLKLKSL